MGDHDFFGDRPRHNGVDLARLDDLGSTPPLVEDSRDEVDPVTDYPEGVSFMPISDTWSVDLGDEGHVRTERNGTLGYQTAYVPGSTYERHFYSGSWHDWVWYAPGEHDHVNIAPLSEDQHAESVAITSYPEGVSAMPASATADWDGNGEDLLIITSRNGSKGVQTLLGNDGLVYSAQRSYASSAWSSWKYHAYTGNIYYNIAGAIVPLATDGNAESAAITSYPSGVSVMPVTSGADWGPNASAAGHVLIERNGSEGKQTFHQYSNSTTYERTYASSAWGSWRDIRDANTLDGIDSTGFAAASHNHNASDINAGTLGIARIPTADDGESNANEVPKANDSRLSNARTPTSHASSHEPGGGDAMAVDAVAATGSLRTLGAGAQQAAAGNDSRLSHARTPTSHASTHTNGTDDIQSATASQKGLATAAQITKLDGIETGATADMTASEIRAALLLATDAVTEFGAITSYPEGISIMPISSTADWEGWATAGEVTTHRVGSRGHQTLVIEDETDFGFRTTEGAGWNGWSYLSTSTSPIHKQLVPLADNYLAESDDISAFFSGITIFGVTAGANWGATNGRAGHVVTERNGSAGKQTFVAHATSATEVRYYTSGAWGSWSSVGGAAAHAATHTNGTDDIQNATASQKGLATAAQITKLDGIETGATNSEQVRSVQTVGAAGEIAVGSDNIILVTATADRTGITVAAGGYDGQVVHIINRSAFTLTLNATESTSRVVGGGVFAPSGRSLLVWDANYGGGGVGRWTRLPSDAVAGIPSFRSLGTGAQQAAAGNDSRLSDSRAPSTREWKAMFFLGGNLSVQTGVGGDHLPNSGTPTITEVSIFVDTKPATQNVIVDINSVNLSTGAKTTLYTTQGNRPAITPGGNHRVNATLPDITQPGVGSVLTCDVDQVGTGTTGANLTVVVRGTY